MARVGKTIGPGEAGEHLLVSHLRLRRILGILGVALPVVVVVWGFALSGWTMHFQDSISDYYALRTRDIFVSVLFLIGWFLATYEGYERVDDIAGYLACLFALGVAFSPNSGTSLERTVHFISATGLFLVLAFFCIFLFTKTKESPGGFRGSITGFRLRTAIASRPGTKKGTRNRIYITCGVLMLLCLVLAALYYRFGKEAAISSIKPVLILETVMIWSFGFSWFVKGETLWRDKKSAEEK